jgi:ATP-dependent DNA helicase RecG
VTTNDPPLLLTPESRERAESQKPRHQSKSQREPLNLRISRYLKTQDATAAEISAHLEQKRLSGQLKIVLKEMIVQGLIEYAVPDKPRSRLQRYRLTEKGKEWLKG